MFTTSSSGSNEFDLVSAFSCTAANTSGKNNQAAIVEAANPPITARPKGAVCEPASPRPDAIGIIPTIIARLVINIGLNLFLTASTADGSDSPLDFLNVSALVTNNIAFATDTPTLMIIPMYDCRFKVEPVITSAIKHPANTAGIVDKTTNETLKL